MTRSFRHQFDPPSLAPVSGTQIHLNVQEIEDAGIREVLQTPGAALGSWAVLDALLEPTGAGSPFVSGNHWGSVGRSKLHCPAYLAGSWLGRTWSATSDWLILVISGEAN
jgi:hypothetical protein